MYKEKMGIKNYLQYPNKKIRVSYTKFRIGDHNLRVERGRWKKKKEAN